MGKHTDEEVEQAVSVWKQHIVAEMCRNGIDEVEAGEVAEEILRRAFLMMSFQEGEDQCIRVLMNRFRIKTV